MASRHESGKRARVPSQRQLRAGELIRHALAEVLIREEVRHEDLAQVAVTVTEVSMSPDLRQANCFIMPLGGRDTDKVLAALHQIGPWLSGQVAKRVRLKFAPRLRFRIDESFDNADRIGQLLHRGGVAADLALNSDEGDNGA